MNLFKIALCNIRKRKAGMITLFLMIIIASLTMMVGLNIVFGLDGYYLKKQNELNSAHFSFYIADTWQNEPFEFAKNYNNVSIAEQSTVYRNLNMEMELNGSSKTTMFNAHAINETKTISPLKIIDKLNTEPSNAVVAPLFVKMSGFKSGDNFSIKADSNVYTFTIHGFFEDAEMGSSTVTIKKFYFSDDAIDMMSKSPDFEKVNYVAIRFNDIITAKTFSEDLQSKFIGNTMDIVSIPPEMSELGATGFISLMSTFIIIFAVIIFLVALIIVRFNIINNIEDDIMNFGALKSVGYTNKQINLSIILQFILISLTACIFGGIFSVLVLPLIGNILTSSSGLLWIKGINLLPVFVAAVFISAVTVLISYLTGRKSKKITPVNALRSGLGGHNFKKNKAPMSKSKLPLQVNLGVKSLLSNIKNNVTIFLVVAMFVFVSILGVLFQYNFSVEKTALTNMIGIDAAPMITFDKTKNSDEEIAAYINEITNDSRVERISYHDMLSIMHQGTELQVEVLKDYSLRQIDTRYDGEYPKYGNQICIGGTYAKSINKGLGDTISVGYKGKEQAFLITGLTQSLNNNGLSLSVTEEGMKRINPDYKLNSVFVYLKDINTHEDFIEEYTQSLKGKATILDAKKMIAGVIDDLSVTIQMVFILIVVITAAVISLVLFLLISTLIRKNKKNFGIMKAMGYSNRQLIRQIIYTFMPVVIISAVIGLIIGLIGANPLLTLALGTMGVVKSNFKVPVPTSVLVTLAIAALSLIVTVLVALKTKKISAIRLITE